jgi:sugar phosphate permease
MVAVSSSSQAGAPVRVRRPFYGWWIVAAATMATFLQGAIFLYGLGALFNPIIADLGWTRTQLSFAVSLATLSGGVAGPLMGHLIDRFGPRALQIYATLSLGLGFVLLSWAQSLLAFYAIFILFMGVGYTVGGVGLAPIAAVANWFIRRRSTAMGIAAIGWGPGGLVWPLVLVTVAEAYGWRMAAIAGGVIILAVGLPAAMLLRHRPERYGLLPDGAAPAMGQARSASGGPARADTRPEADFGVGQALRTPTFWLLSVTMTLGFMVTPAVGLHQIPFLIEKGLDPAAAAAVLGLMTLMSIPGRLVFGVLGDRYDKRLLLAAALLLQSLGLLVLTGAEQLWQLVLYTAVFGTGFGGLRPLSTALPADYFGRRAYGSIRGAASSIQVAGTMIAPVLAGWITDSVGTYVTAFLVLAGLNAAGLVTTALLRPPKLPSVTTQAVASGTG